jgi:hypothetical protein
MLRDDRHNCADPPTLRPADAAALLSATTLEVFPVPTPTSQISFCRSGTQPDESYRRRSWSSCVGSRPAGLSYGLCTVRHAPRPETGSLLLNSQFRRQRFSEFLTAGLSRRRSRVRAPSSPPFLFNVFPAFSNVCRRIPRYGSRRHATATDTKCPQYSDQTVAATVALGLEIRGTRFGGYPRLAEISGLLFPACSLEWEGGRNSRNFPSCRTAMAT